MTTKRTEIDKLGEFGLIDHLTENFETKNASTVLSIGDDAAIIDHFGKQTVITTDLLIEGVHFDLIDRKSTRLNSSHVSESRMPSSA